MRKKPLNLRRNAKWRKTDCKLQGGVGVGRCMGVHRGYRGYGGTPGGDQKFPRNSGKIPGSNEEMVRSLEVILL